jgi:hypothetical protein
MSERTIESSPQFFARICGILYLINIACGMFGEVFVRSRLLVSGDAVATAHNIMASETLFRLSIARRPRDAHHRPSNHSHPLFPTTSR